MCILLAQRPGLLGLNIFYNIFYPFWGPKLECLIIYDNIYLPISLGEAIDKLTILHIKVDKIKDNEFVKKEYDLLYEKLKEYFNEFYISLKKINLIIWDQMDILRDGNLNDSIACYNDCLQKSPNDIQAMLSIAKIHQN